MNFDKIIKDTLKIEEGSSYPMFSKRRYGRENIPSLFNKFGFKIGAEIGVFRGVFSKCLLEGVPGLKLKCIDIWKGYRRHDDEEVYNSVKRDLEPFGAEIIRMPSVDASDLVEDESLDFVYIDAHHSFDSVTNDLNAWIKKVRSGGVISGHDYYTGGNCGVLKAVNKYVKDNNIIKWYVTREKKCKSFLWIKKG